MLPAKLGSDRIGSQGIRHNQNEEDQDASHPMRPYSKEGRLIISTKDALESTKSETKEQVLRVIGESLKNLETEDKDIKIKQPKRSFGRDGARKAKQRKSPSRRPSNQRKKKFGRK